MSQFLKSSMLDRMLQLNIADHMFLAKLADKTFNEDEYFSKLEKYLDLDFVTKMSFINQDFARLCQQEKYDLFWAGHYCSFGSRISAHEKNPVTFYKHPVNCHFDLLRGAYFFYYAQLARRGAGSDFCYEEIAPLKEAIKFHSIHAQQRYNQYIYQQIDSNKITPQEKETLLKTIIDSCKAALEMYGSYAYMMLAEAYVRYAIWAKENYRSQVNLAIAAAKKSCEMAVRYLQMSQYSIHNASLGKGLECSNTLGFATPEAAIQYLQDWETNQGS